MQLRTFFLFFFVEIGLVFSAVGTRSKRRGQTKYDAQEKRNEGKNRREIHNKKSWMKKRDENSQPEMLEGAKLMGAGAATIASAGAAVGIGNVLSSSIHSVARNPSLAKQSFGYAILGFALTEAIASFAPMMAFLISFVFRSKKEKKVSVS